jgi:hypothetical protein
VREVDMGRTFQTKAAFMPFGTQHGEEVEENFNCRRKGQFSMPFLKIDPTVQELSYLSLCEQL